MGPHPQAACRRRRGRGGDPRRARRPADPLAARSRHRHRADAGTVRQRYRARPRPRSFARHAGARPRAPRPRRPQALQRAPGRHLRSRLAARFLRRRDHPPGAALPRRQRARDARGGARAAAGRPAARRRFRAARSRIPARRARPSPARLCRRDRHGNGSRPPASTSCASRRCRPDRRARSRFRSGSGAIRASCWRCRQAARWPDGRPPHQPLRRRPRRRAAIRVSFEFFPPKTAEMERTLWEAIGRLAPLAAEFRLGHLRRRRLDPRAHARDGEAHSRRDHADAGGASHLRRARPAPKSTR